MRTIITMICAVIGAATAMLVFSPTIADTIVASYRFDSSDAVADWHTAIYLTCNILGLLAGWTVGWIVAGAGRRA